MADGSGSAAVIRIAAALSLYSRQLRRYVLMDFSSLSLCEQYDQLIR